MLAYQFAGKVVTLSDGTQYVLNMKDFVNVTLPGGVVFSSANPGQYMQGKYPFMIFGLPAAALAMVMAAPKGQNRKLAFSTVIGAALTSFVTGITEPIEFTFLFLAPALFYGFHAVAAAISFWLMNLLKANMGMTFSGGFIDFAIYGILPENYKTILKLHAGGDEGAKDLIISFLTSQTSTSYKEDIAPLTGKASDKDPSKGINSNFLDQVQRDQIGVDRPFELITKDNNSKLYSLNSKYISQLPNVSEDMSLNEMLGKSKIGSIMDSRLGVTFGDQVINPDNFKDIMFDPGGGATIVTLPCKYENGHKVVNFAIKDEYDSAVKEVSNTIPVDYTNPRFIQKLAEKLHEKGLDSLLNGSNLDPNMFGHFMVVSAYTTDKVKFKTDSNYIEKVKNPDKDLENRIIKGLSTNKDKNDYELDVDDKWGWFELTYDDIYRGNVFIPLNNDPVSAQTGWGSDNNLTETRQLAEQYQNFQKSSKQKDSSSSNL